MQILGFCDSACIFAHACHADFEFLCFCMLFCDKLSCRFWDSAILHVFSRMLVMRFFGFCDSACIFAHACHADLEFLQFRMLFRSCLSCESGVSAIPHVVSRLVVMRFLEFCDSDIVNIGLHFILKNVRPYAASSSEA